jgi:hypothetical protein
MDVRMSDQDGYVTFSEFDAGLVNGLADAIRTWCAEHQLNTSMSIAYCGVALGHIIKGNVPADLVRPCADVARRQILAMALGYDDDGRH